MESYELLSADQRTCRLSYELYKLAKDDMDTTPRGMVFDSNLITKRLQRATELLMIAAKVGDYCGTAWVLDDLHESVLLRWYFAAVQLGPVMTAIENGHIDTVELFLLLTSWSVTDEMLTRARISKRQKMIDFLVELKEQPRVLDEAGKARLRTGWNRWRLGPHISFRDVLDQMEDAAWTSLRTGELADISKAAVNPSLNAIGFTY